MKLNFLFFGLASLFIISCSNHEDPIVIEPNAYHDAIDRVIDIQVHDIFSPPVASRIFAYSNIAAYEVLCQGNANYQSLSGQLTDLKPVPKPQDTSKLNYEAAALIAYYEVAKQLIFSEDRITTYRDSLFNSWNDINEESFKNSKEFGMAVAAHIKQWLAKDNYAETRTMPKFTVQTDVEGRWQPTPPAYMDGIEPHWSLIRPFVIDSASQFKPIPPPEFSMKEGTQFHKELMEVYDTGKRITAASKTSEEVAIARFWDCNPYVSTHQGHLMFATKKITPGAHWIGITKIAARKAKADFMKTVAAYTKTSIALADGFIVCWDEKYRSNLIRPETLINKYIDENWVPILQTPPFPEYTSGHSVVSGAAGIVLTDTFGEDFSFNDDTETRYGLPIRSFNSFNEASAEAAISRMYGGIHYRAAVEVGLEQGRKLGHYIIHNLKMEITKDELASIE